VKPLARFHIAHLYVRIKMNRRPKQFDQCQKSRICDNCAWTPERIHSETGGIKYYCYHFDETFKWEFENKHDVGFLLGMNPCSAFHAIPTDTKRGAEFAKYFQNKTQIEAYSRRSWISIGIALFALIVSIIAVYLGYKNN